MIKIQPLELAQSMPEPKSQLLSPHPNISIIPTPKNSKTKLPLPIHSTLNQINTIPTPSNSSSNVLLPSQSFTFPQSNPAHLFCSSKSEINFPNEYGWTPLYRSLISKNINAMKELLLNGADPNITNNMGETPLFQSVDMDYFEGFTLLLENNANCNICKNDGNSPLHIAVKKGLINYIELLLKYKADPNLKNKLYQQTPLHLAIKNKADFSIIKILFDYNADFNMMDKYDKRPIDYCNEENDNENDNNNEYNEKINELFGIQNSVNNNVDNKADEDNNNNNKRIKTFRGYQSSNNFTFSAAKYSCNNDGYSSCASNISSAEKKKHDFRKNIKDIKEGSSKTLKMVNFEMDKKCFIEGINNKENEDPNRKERTFNTVNINQIDSAKEFKFKINFDKGNDFFDNIMKEINNTDYLFNIPNIKNDDNNNLIKDKVISPIKNQNKNEQEPLLKLSNQTNQINQINQIEPSTNTILNSPNNNNHINTQEYIQSEPIQLDIDQYTHTIQLPSNFTGLEDQTNNNLTTDIVNINSNSNSKIHNNNNIINNNNLNHQKCFSVTIMPPSLNKTMSNISLINNQNSTRKPNKIPMINSTNSYSNNSNSNKKNNEQIPKTVSPKNIKINEINNCNTHNNSNSNNFISAYSSNTNNIIITEDGINKKNASTSLFHFSTPKDNLDNLVSPSSLSNNLFLNDKSNNNKEVNVFYAENTNISPFAPLNKERNNSNINSNNKINSENKDIISDMNPLDYINPIITMQTNNSNIFSELQNNTNTNLSGQLNSICSISKTKTEDMIEDELKRDDEKDDKSLEDINIVDNILANNNDSLEDNNNISNDINADEGVDSNDNVKEKNIIVPELPLTTIKNNNNNYIINNINNNNIIYDENDYKTNNSINSINNSDIIETEREVLNADKDNQLSTNNNHTNTNNTNNTNTNSIKSHNNSNHLLQRPINRISYYHKCNPNNTNINNNYSSFNTNSYNKDDLYSDMILNYTSNKDNDNDIDNNDKDNKIIKKSETMIDINNKNDINKESKIQYLISKSKGKKDTIINLNNNKDGEINNSSNHGRNGKNKFMINSNSNTNINSDKSYSNNSPNTNLDKSKGKNNYKTANYKTERINEYESGEEFNTNKWDNNSKSNNNNNKCKTLKLQKNRSTINNYNNYSIASTRPTMPYSTNRNSAYSNNSNSKRTTVKEIYQLDNNNNINNNNLLYNKVAISENEDNNDVNEEYDNSLNNDNNKINNSNLSNKVIYNKKINNINNSRNSNTANSNLSSHIILNNTTINSQNNNIDTIDNADMIIDNPLNNNNITNEPPQIVLRNKPKKKSNSIINQKEKINQKQSKKVIIYQPKKPIQKPEPSHLSHQQTATKTLPNTNTYNKSEQISTSHNHPNEIVDPSYNSKINNQNYNLKNRILPKSKNPKLNLNLTSSNSNLTNTNISYNNNDNDNNENNENNDNNDLSMNSQYSLYSSPVSPRNLISPAEAKRLHSWLLSCDLLPYYNTLIDQGIYQIDKCIEGIQKGELILGYKDIEDIGIKKPGHIYRFLMKLLCDAGKIDKRIINFLIPNKILGEGILKTSINRISLGISQTCCGCTCTVKGVNDKGKKELDIESWLKFRGISYLKDNFIHNGFDTIEFLMIQMFSDLPFNEDVLIDCLHIYSRADRRKVMEIVEAERKYICECLGINYVSMEKGDAGRAGGMGGKCECVVF